MIQISFLGTALTCRPPRIMEVRDFDTDHASIGRHSCGTSVAAPDAAPTPAGVNDRVLESWYPDSSVSIQRHSESKALP